jgi:hypothetical protein
MRASPAVTWPRLADLTSSGLEAVGGGSSRIVPWWRAGSSSLTRYVRPGSVRVEWQLYELDTGELHRCPPKAESHWNIHTPDWLGRLVSEHVARTPPTACRCHELTYVFSGHRPPDGAVRRPGATLADVARRAGMSPATASAALNHPEVVHEVTRSSIEKAVADLGYVRSGADGELAAHWRRNNFATRLFQPAPQVSTRARVGSVCGQCPCSASRGRVSRCEVATPRAGPTAAGYPWPPAWRHTGCATLTGLSWRSWARRPSWQMSGWGTRTVRCRRGTRTSHR